MKRFTVVVTMRGYDNEREDRLLRSLERRDRRLEGGRGFSFIDGSRDISFDTTKSEIAKRLQSNLRKALKENRIRGSVTIFVDENV